MRFLLFILAVVAFLIGFGLFSISTSAVHESLAMLTILVGAVFLSGAGIVEAIHQLQKKLLKALESNDANK